MLAIKCERVKQFLALCRGTYALLKNVKKLRGEKIGLRLSERKNVTTEENKEQKNGPTIKCERLKQFLAMCRGTYSR